MTADQLTPDEIFAEALHREGSERTKYLDDVLSGDTAVRECIERLLRAHAEAESFLETPAKDPLATEGDDRQVSERPGTVIGPYKLLQQIGEGGMGVVFMAEQTEPIQRTAALKIIKPGMDTRQVIARFEAERQAVAMMDHPNIAKVLDAGTTDSGRPYFVMELVKGVPVTKYCDEKQLPLRARLELFVQVCQAVQHAHQKGIIHRDIKPNNVLVAEYDNRAVPKVIDFGVAKATAQRLTERTMFTEFGQVLGTMEYMSPEQSKFNQLDIDTRSDIYSLGVLLYELLAGSTPFEGKRLHEAAFDEMLRIIREEEPPKPSTRLSSIDTLPSVATNRHTEPARLSKDVRGELDWIVMKALEKDRNRRYETASGFAADIERHLHDQPVEAGPPSAVYRFRKFAMRNKAGLLTAALLVLVLLLGSVISTWQALRAHRAERIAQTRLASETAVTGFLQEMLASANPETLKGSEYTVHQLLDDFSAGLAKQLAGQPEVEATVRGVIGKAYWRMGKAGSANVHLKAALDLRRRVLPPDDTRIADSLLDYALNLSLLNSRNNPTAETYAREALRIYQTQKAGPGAVLPALWALQQFLNRQGRPAEAAAIADEALAIAGDLEKTPYPDVANILHELARIKSGEGKQAEAENLARKSVALHRRLHGDNHPDTAWGLHRLGLVLAADKKYPAAEAAYREALAIFRYHYSNNPESVRMTLEGVKNALKAQGNEAGLATLERDELELSGTDLRVVTTSLEWQLQTAPPWSARIDLAERAVTVAQYAPRAQREAIAAAILKHARTKFHGWDWSYQPAKQLADLATQLYRSLAAEYPSEANQLGLADSLCLLGWAETKLGTFPQSERTLREALRVTDDAVAHFDKSRSLRQKQAIAHRLLGDALARQKSTKEAIGHCRTSIAITSALIEEGRPLSSQVEQMVYARVCLAEALASPGSLDAAAAEYRTALAAIEKASADFPSTVGVSQIAADCFERMARVLPGVARENPAQSQLAHRLIVEAIEQFNKLRGSLDPNRWEARGPLAMGQKNMIVFLASDTAWAAEADQAEQGFRALLAAWTKNINGCAHAWRSLAFSLPHDTRNLPRIEAAFREAIGVLDRFLAQSPADLLHWGFLADSEFRLGGICQERQDIKEAEAAFRRAIEIINKNGGQPAMREESFFPKREEVYLALAALLARNGRTAEAIDEIDGAIKFNSSSMELWASRSQFNADLGRWDNAVEDLTQAGKLTSVAERPELWAQLALLRLAAHDKAAYRQKCATLVEKSLPNNPQGDQAHHIAWACVLLPDSGVDPAQVVRIAQAAVAANTRDPDYLISLGAALYRAGRHEEAAKTLADAEAAYQHEQTTPTPGIYVNTTITYCHLFLAMTHQRLDHHDEAKGWLKKAVEEIDALDKPPRAADYPWNRRLALEVLRKEAESLVTRAPTKDQKEDAAKTPG